MPSFDHQIANLQAAIAAQDGLRPALGDAIVQATNAALRVQLDALLAQQAAGLHPLGSPQEASPPSGPKGIVRSTSVSGAGSPVPAGSG